MEVVGRGRMKFNKTELAQLASQPSHKFDKEGVLFVRERKQEGFFKRNEGEIMEILITSLVKTIFCSNICFVLF